MAPSDGTLDILMEKLDDDDKDFLKKLIENFSSENLEYFDSREKVLSFIQNVRGSHADRFRLTILGQQGSGKTSLIQSIKLVFRFNCDNDCQ